MKTIKNSKGRERGAREGGARPPASEASYPRFLKELKEIKDKLPKYNNYIFTISINDQLIIKSLNCQIYEYIKYFNKLLINLDIKIFYYTIEQSKHGKIHCHGIFNRKELPTYQSINDRYPGVQIYIKRYAPTYTYFRDETTFEVTSSVMDIGKDDWHHYINKDPLRLVFYKYGKNYVDYKHLIATGGSERSERGGGRSPLPL